MRYRLLWLILALGSATLVCWRINVKHYEAEITKSLDAGNVAAAATLLTKWSAHGGTKDPKYFRCFAELEKKLDHPEGVEYNLQQALVLEGK